MIVRNFINISKYSNRKKAYMCYPSMCGSMQSTITWAHKYANRDTDFALKLLDIAIKEREKVENVIKRYNRRFS